MRFDGWDQDRWTMTGADGKPLLVLEVTDGLQEAAQAVIKLMYEEVVPEGASGLHLAKVGVWGETVHLPAPAC
jgi:hypothetical protein